MSRADCIVTALILTATGLILGRVLAPAFGTATGLLLTIYNALALLAGAAYFGGLGIYNALTLLAGAYFGGLGIYNALTLLAGAAYYGGLGWLAVLLLADALERR